MPAHPAVLTSKPEWQTLKEHRERLEGVLMKDLFDKDPGRAKRYFIEGAGLSLDFSKNRLTDEVLEALLALASSCDLEARREALLQGSGSTLPKIALPCIPPCAIPATRPS